jgi:hypothetical protein
VAASAQAGTGYVTAGPAFVTGIGNRDYAWQVVGGGEVGAGHVRFGGTVEYVFLPEFYKADAYGSSSAPAAHLLGFAGHGSFYFNREYDARVQPYINGGMTFYADGTMIPTLQIAGGVDWWASRHTGLRIEARQQYGAMFSVRCGVVFR